MSSPHSFRLPWEASLECRMNRLREQTAKKRVLYIYPRPDSSTFRYRVYNMIQSLSYSVDWEGHFFYANELEPIQHLLKRAQVIVFVRTPWTAAIQNSISKAKSLNIPILFDVDDLVFDVEKVPFIMNSLNCNLQEPNEIEYWFSYCSRIWLVGNQADAFICTNAFLAKELQRVFHKTVHVVPNFLNQEQIDYSASLFDQRRNEAIQNFTMGYFSGTPSHFHDFETILPELLDLMHEHPNLSLKVVGYLEPSDKLKPLIDQKRITFSPLVDFLTLQKKISEVQINLVPLVDNQFTNCKSELKFFEAAIVGTLTCATPIFTYAEAIQDGNTGYLCNQGEWYHRISDVLTNGIHPDIIQIAQEYCLKQYSPCNYDEKITQILSSPT